MESRLWLETQVFKWVYPLIILIAHDTFGLPIIESLACGTPVLCNDSCSFNELLCLEQWEGTVERAYFYITLEDLDEQLQSFINREKRIHPQDLLSIKEKNCFHLIELPDSIMIP